jgi:hypothetical protein
MALPDFLNDPVNSRTRERIYFHRVAFDLYLAAALRGYHLQMFEPEVDRDGFDIVLNDGELERHIQVKTVLRSAATPSWEIAKRLLRPTAYVGEKLDPNFELKNAGLEGGVLLVEVDETDGQHVTYFYTNYFTLLALREGIFGTDADTGERILRRLLEDSTEPRIDIPKTVFLKAKNSHGVLGLIGLDNVLMTALYPYHLVQYFDAPVQLPPGQILGNTKGVLKENISGILVKLTA